MQEQIVSTFMNLFNDNYKCYRDEYNRKMTRVLIENEEQKSVFTEEFHDSFMSYMTTHIEGLTVVSNDYCDYRTIRFSFKGGEVVMICDFDHFRKNWITFVKLNYNGDKREFFDASIDDY